MSRPDLASSRSEVQTPTEATGRHRPASTDSQRRWPASTDGRRRSGFRPDIQGLRAIAVGIVVVYHLYPHALPGGFVGVDVFFVISGFLITGQLAKVTQRTGRVRLIDFYGRRLRRLMPSAVLVLAVTWLVSLQVLPTTQLPATAEQIRASALYFQNWQLAHDAVTYLTSDAAATPVQHYWSLSVEEQFYVVWPLLFLLAVGAAVLLTRRLAARRHPATAERRRAVALVVMFVFSVAVFGVSLAVSARLTATNPAAAYFVTTTRMWELALGGMLALAPAVVTDRLARFGPLAWVGLVMVGASAFLISGSSAFPGTIALWPVGGAALLVACGSARARFGPARLTSLRPMVFLGDISYPLYLWHWPIIVLWESYSGGRIGPYDGTAIIVVSIALSWLTKTLVEEPFRRSRFITRAQWRSIALAVVIAIPVAMATVFLAGQTPTPPPSRIVAHELNSKHPGAAVLATGKSVAPATPIPTLAIAAHNFGAYGTGPGGCQTPQTSSKLTQCEWGDTTNYTKTIALVGDSVAGEWFGDINALAKAHHWLLVTNLHSLCPWTSTLAQLPGHDEPYTTCQKWGENVLHALLTKIKPSLVITSERPSVGTAKHPKPDKTSFAQLGRGMVPYWQQLISHGIGVAAIRESPEMGIDIPDCLSKPGATTAQCSVPAAKAVLTGTPLMVATDEMHGAVPLIDLTRYICAPVTCEPVVGNVVVYIDDHHVTNTYATTVGPYLDQQLLDKTGLH